MKIHYTNEQLKPDDIFFLYEELDWNSFLSLNRQQLVAAMQKSWLTIYAYVDEELVGTGRVISDGVTNAYLCGLGVKQKHRGQGIGTAITQQLLQQCRNHGLHAQFFCEEHLIPFYTKMGFEVFSVGMRLKAAN